eukprot:CAMPEP_0176478290 /NCGR_PEP_ID=MMETSP0200_2-20121128/1107_1 /TAXON_ID=947934 /ORGANISM="Chaetoceros sp., Strain GSL56" /LENGTH=700 /DNA_ID=CAMNT_0017874217 /DNA_START=262 /DNA_END=2364 /DNA_ORIENTATION=-
MKQVSNGERSKSFAKYYRKSVAAISDEYSVKIVSTHGRNQVDDMVNFEGPALLLNGNQISTTCREMYFPQDGSSLDMVFTPEMYAVARKEIQERIASESKDDHERYSSKILFVPKLFMRAIQLGINFSPVTLTCGIAAISQTFRDQIWYRMLGNCLAKSGPAFIKWGQWASTRSDMFPDAFCTALSELHADAPAHSWKITQRTVEESLCIPKGSLFLVFQSFEREPVASGSIAQIHKAVIKLSGVRPCDSSGVIKLANVEEKAGNGTLVAVKVRHPNVAKLIDMDFRLMSILANIIECLPGLGWLRIRSSVEQFSHTMAAQAHLNVEAYHLEVLNYNFRQWDEVGFPKPIFACPKVIIETFEEGKICSTIIDQYDRLGSDVGLVASDVMPIPLAKFIVTKGLALYLKMLIVDNLMHADLHPGNIMIVAELFGKGDPISSMLHSEDPTAKHAMKMAAAEVAYGFYGHITLVDAGMVAQLEEDESANFIGLMSSLGAGDGRTAAQSVLKFSQDENYLTEEEKEAFTQDMIKYFNEKCRGYGTNVDVGEVLRGVLGIIKNHHVRIDANYATLVVNALCIEGMAKRVCPSYNVLDAAKPLLSAYRSLPIYKSKSQALKKLVMNFVTPILYSQKNAFDKTFFNKLTQEKQRYSFLRKLSKTLTNLLILGSSTLMIIQFNRTEEDKKNDSTKYTNNNVIQMPPILI